MTLTQSTMSLGQLDDTVLNEIAETCECKVDAFEDVYWCTPFQLGVMADTMKQSGAYTHRLVVELEQTVDPDRFCAALNQVIAINATLRTRIVDCSLGTVQVVFKDAPTVHCEPGDFEQYMHRDEQRPIGLCDPLLRAAIFDRKLILGLHHAVGDAWTIRAVFRDLSAIYEGRKPVEHAPFKDFVEYCCHVDNSEVKTFWASRFSSIPTSFPPVDAGHVLRPTQHMSKEINLEHEHGELTLALLPAYIEAAWALTARTYTGSNSVNFGLVLSGRSARLGGLETTLGPTLATIPVQVNFEDGVALSTVLKDLNRQRRSVQNSPALQYGLANIRNVSNEARLTSAFQTVLNVRTPGAEDTGSVDFKIAEKERLAGPYGLTLMCTLQDTGIFLEASSDPDVIATRQMHRILRQFEYCLQLLVRADLQTTIDDLKLFNPGDWEEISSWNHHLPAPLTLTMHQLFEHQARTRPSAMAIDAHDGSASYQDLDEMSSRVGADLKRRGVGVESAVAFIFEKSMWAIVAILGIWKAGGACVPVDVASPRARKEAIIRSARADLILTSSAYYADSVGIAPNVVVIGDKTVPSPLDYEEGESDGGCQPAHAAYIIFTSGSTGTPKGVVLEHRCLTTSISAQIDRVGLRPGFRSLQFAAYGWDASILEIFGPLITGACVCVPSEEDRASGLVDYINAQRLDCLVLTPTVLRTINPSDVPSVRMVISGGEPLPVQLAKSWAAAVRFFNAWGPCETTIIGTAAELTSTSLYPTSIGTAVGSATWITDPRDVHQLMQIGAVGEIVVEGPGVARGYLDEDDRSASRFICPPQWAPHRSKHPWSSALFYRTGDLAKYNSDGSVCFIGRLDTQVKLRGQRFELGEVEEMLHRCDDVRNACVFVQECSSAEDRVLVAVVSLTDPKLPSTTVLQDLHPTYADQVELYTTNILRRLEHRLPSFMVPSKCLVVEQFPTMSSAKLDRMKVSQWLKGKGLLFANPKLGATANLTITPPSSQAEQALQAVWSSVLTVPSSEIGRESSFIAMGGDSIKAMHVAAKYRRCGFRITVVALLSSESLMAAAESSQAIERSHTPEEESKTTVDDASLLSGDAKSLKNVWNQLAALGLKDSDVEDVHPCSAVQDGMLFAETKRGAWAYWNRITLSVKLSNGSGDIDVQRLGAAWKTLCSAHSILRTIFTTGLSTESAFQQIVLRHATPSIQYIQATSQSDALSKLARLAQPPSSPAQPPHCLLICQAPGSICLLALGISHTITDAATMHLIGKGLGIAYGDPTLIPKGPDFAQHVAFLQKRREADLQYWTSYLRGARPCLVPTEATDDKPIDDKVNSNDMFRVNGPAGDARKLTTFCQDHHITLANFMQVAWAIVLRQMTRTASTCFGCLHSGRDASEAAQEMLGPLMTMMVCRYDLKPDTSVLELLHKGREDSFRALEHSGSSLMELHEKLDLGIRSLFNTAMTILHDWPDDFAAGSKIKLELMNGEDHTEYAVTVHVAFSREGFVTTLAYRATDVRTSIMEDMARTYAQVIDHMMENPARPAMALAYDCRTGQAMAAPFIQLPRDAAEDVKHRAAMQCEVPRSFIEDIYPCTPLQSELMASATKSQGNDIIQRILRPEPAIPIQRLCDAWELVEAANPILRTRIVAANGPSRDLQVVLKLQSQWIEHEDLVEYLEWDRGVGVRYGGPLCRISRVCESSGAAYVVISLHSTICDEWTLRILSQAWEKAYHCASVPKAPRFSDFVHFVTNRDVEDEERSWTTQLAGSRDYSTIPNAQDSGTSPMPWKTRILAISAPQTQPGVTMSSLLHAAWALCLSRITGDSRVRFGMIFSGRNAPIPGITEICGPTTALVPCAVDIPARSKCIDLIQWMEDYAHKTTDSVHMGIESIRALSEDIAVACSFGSTLTVDSLLCQTWSIPTAPFASLCVPSAQTRSSGVDLAIKCLLSEEEVHIEVAFNPQAIPSGRAELMLQQYAHAIAQLASSTTSELFGLEPISSHELSLLRTWNAKDVEPVEACIQEQIKETARRQPLAPAVYSWDASMDFGRLDDLSDRLAAHLHAGGIIAETIVPFFFEKSATAVVAMLGILKAGGALLPLDIDHPSDRIKAILRDSAASTVLCSRHLRNKVATLALNTVSIDLVFLASLPRAMPPGAYGSKPSNACYVIFTSGSTGTPKGILVSHVSFATSMSHQRRRIGISADTRSLQYLNFIFDMALYDIFVTLLCGGCICMPSETERTDDIVGFVNRAGCNFAFLTPSLASIMSPAAVPTLRTLALAGEPVRRDVIDSWQRNLCLIIAYGPAEASGLSSSRDVSADTGKNHLDIGPPAGCRYWVVDADDHDTLVPIGSPGELVIEGPIVACGYLRNKELTDAAFIGRPVWSKQFETLRLSHRFYKTGDIVAQPAVGSFIFHGRKDGQVKLRGQRIELGEIESNLMKFAKPGAKIAVELVRPVVEEQSACLAVFSAAHGYVYGKSESRVARIVEPDWPFLEGSAVVQKALAASLPPYMVPDVHICLEYLPLTLSGKTDRRSLRAIGESLTLQELLAHSLLTPRNTKGKSSFSPSDIKPSPALNDLEARMRELWSTALSLPRDSISVSDDFFGLSGNSLRAIKMVGIAREQGLLLSVADVFRHPRLGDMARMMKTESRYQPAVLPFSLLETTRNTGDAREQAAALCGVEEAKVADVLPPTPLQEGLLAMAARRPGDYVLQLEMEIHHHIDITRLRRAWEEVVRTTPILRTRLVDIRDHGLAQVILDEPVDWKQDNYPLGGVRKSLSTFDFGEPLNHVALYTGNNGTTHFALTMHHAVYDGWSWQLLLRSLESIYWKDRPEPRASFLPFIQHAMTSKSKTAMEYWRNQFSGLDAPQFPSLPSVNYQPRADLELEHTVTGLKPPPGGFTMATAIRAAWAALVTSYTGSKEAVFGVVESGRKANVPGIERVAGPTVSTIPLRITIDEDISVAQLLRQIQDQAASTTQFEQLGIHNIRRLSVEAEDACRFQTLVVVQPRDEQKGNTAGSSLFANTQIANTRAFQAFSTYAVTLVCDHAIEDSVMRFSFDSRVVSHAQIERMAHQLAHILHQLCSPASDGKKVGDIERTSELDLGNIWTWNAVVPEASEELVHKLIASTVQKQPERSAVHAWDGNLTYRELDALSSRLAHQLARMGVKSEDIVPLCFEKSMWNSVAALAVMKAGGASVLLDPGQPEERLRQIVRQVKPVVFLCSQVQHDVSKRLTDAPLVIVSANYFGENMTAPRKRDRELPAVQPASALYVVFTSGSTGTPKGVVITHRNFSNALYHQGGRYGPSAGSRVFDFPSYAFDMSWYNLLYSLCCGACLCVPSDEERQHDISGAVVRLEANFFLTTPTVASMLDGDALRHLKTIEIGGESVEVGIFSKLKDGRDLRLLYGPTECTMVATASHDMRHPSHLGYGLGVVTWVVDSNNPQTLSPIGAIGELWLEGPLVGRGYLGDADKTAAAFIADPLWLTEGFSGRAGRQGRLYRTGDLVRYDDDGSLRFAGRKDGQVKIRGQRVELNEVESHVQRLFSDVTGHGDVQVAAEVVTSQDGERPALMVFVVPSRAGNLTELVVQNIVADATSKIDARLEKTVPQYMIPNNYFALTRMPLTRTGKIDRRSLRGLGAARMIRPSPAAGDFVAPSDETERVLQHIWCEVLNLPAASISVETRLSRLGMDSILAMQAVARCRRSHIRLTVADVLELQSIRRLSVRSKDNERSRDLEWPVIHPSSDTPRSSFPLSPIQRYYFETTPEGNVPFDASILLKPRQKIAPATLQKALHILVLRHPVLMARFERDRLGNWTQYLQNDANSSYHLQLTDAYRDEEIGPIIASCRERQDITRGPLLSANLIETSNSQLLFLSCHHVIIDYMSWRILAEELEQLLMDRPLPSLSCTSFQWWCAALDRYAAEELHPDGLLPFELEPSNLTYWSLTEEQARTRPWATLNLEFDPGVSAGILGWCNDVFQTQPVELMVAALMHSFGQAFSDRSVPPCFCEGHGREPWDESIDLSQTVGWFTTIFPVQLGQDARADLQRSVHSVRDRMRSLPCRGWAYFTSRYSNVTGREVLRQEGCDEINFNYLGAFNQFERPSSLFEILEVPPGSEPASGSKMNNLAVFYVVAMPVNGKLTFTFRYCCTKALAARWVDQLEQALPTLLDLARRMRKEDS